MPCPRLASRWRGIWGLDYSFCIPRVKDLESVIGTVADLSGIQRYTRNFHRRAVSPCCLTHFQMVVLFNILFLRANQNKGSMRC